MMTIREYKKAESLEEAWQLNQKKPNRVLGGMIWLKMENINVGTAIDLSGLGLDTIEETDEGFSIGAMVTLRQLELHPGLAAYTDGAVRESVRHIVGVQLRNLATVGGSIYSRFGFSDVLTMFLALNASVELYKGGIVPLAEYARRPYDRDILVRVIVPKEDAKFCYQSVRNSQTDIPVLTCAAAKNAAGEYRFAIGARPGKAVLYTLPADAGETPELTSARFAASIRSRIKTESNMRGSAEYRNHLAGVLVMTVDPGFAGQQLVPAMLQKLRDLRAFLDENGYPDLEIEVDGNVSFENAEKMRQAGATMFVGGSSSVFWKGASLSENIQRMYAVIGKRNIAVLQAVK